MDDSPLITIDRIDKSVKRFLAKYAFEQMNKEKSEAVHRRLVKFFDSLTKNGTIEKAAVTYFGINGDRSDRLDIELKMTPLWPTKTLIFKIGDSKNTLESSNNE